MTDELRTDGCAAVGGRADDVCPDDSCPAYGRADGVGADGVCPYVVNKKQALYEAKADAAAPT